MYKNRPMKFSVYFIVLYHISGHLENSEDAFRFVVVIPTWNFCLHYFTNFTTIAPETETFQGMFDTITGNDFVPKFCIAKLRCKKRICTAKYFV